MSAEDLHQLVASGFQQYTPKTITDGESLLTYLAQVRAQGYALDDEERHVGLRCVAAPVTDRSGMLRAALSISGSAAEFTADRLQHSIQAVRQAAADLSRSLLEQGS